jgi:hypothetical protein
MINKSNWCAEFSLNRDCKLTMTDIERRRVLRDLIMSSENILAILAQDRQINIGEIDLETTILKTGKQLENKLDRFIMYFETQ